MAQRGGGGMVFFWSHPAGVRVPQREPVPHQKSPATVRGGWRWGSPRVWHDTDLSTIQAEDR